MYAPTRNTYLWLTLRYRRATTFQDMVVVDFSRCLYRFSDMSVSNAKVVCYLQGCVGEEPQAALPRGSGGLCTAALGWTRVYYTGASCQHLMASS